MNPQELSQYIKADTYNPGVFTDIKEFIGDRKVIILHNPDVDIEDEEILGKAIANDKNTREYGFVTRMVPGELNGYEATFLVPAADIPEDSQQAISGTMIEIRNTFFEATEYLPFDYVDIQVVTQEWDTGYVVLIVNGEDYINGVKSWPY